jgi:DGQHR domain-containing protein
MPIMRVPGFTLQVSPLIYVTATPGPWLLEHSTPVWRIDDPEKGFQRVVKEERARKIASDVLDQHRTFPNALVLATDVESFVYAEGRVSVPSSTRFLVVDGQHRLWAQKYSDYKANYACVVHMGLTEVGMANLFLEINDNQKRVPSSLRWDLVRLVRPDDDPFSIATSELVYELATEKSSPLYQRIDLTGEQKEISLKQGSIAPELRSLVAMKPPGLRGLPFDEQYEVLIRYLAAIRSLDPDGWMRARSPFYKARVLRVLLRALPLVARKIGKSAPNVATAEYRAVLEQLDKTSYTPEAIRAAQGSAGMKQIFDQVRAQLQLP